MKKILSVYFSSERVYLTVCGQTAKGLSLEYINSTFNPYDLANHESEESFKAAEELSEIISGLGSDINEINFTLPAENVLVSKIPYSAGTSKEELRELVNFEIRQSYPQFSFSEFKVDLVPLEPDVNGRQMLLAVIIPKSDLRSGIGLFRSFGLPVNNFEISQLSAHNALLYNYPEIHGKTIVLFGIQGQFVDISVIKNGNAAYYNLASLPFADQIGKLCKNEIGKILSENVSFVDGAYFFGTGLTKSILDEASIALKDMVNFSGRLNAFRMVTTYLGSRERQYCSRVAHIFPPCIGNSLPEYNNRIELS